VPQQHVNVHATGFRSLEPTASFPSVTAFLREQSTSNAISHGVLLLSLRITVQAVIIMTFEKLDAGSCPSRISILAFITLDQWESGPNAVEAQGFPDRRGQGSL
jgi:hypothetical protein